MYAAAVARVNDMKLSIRFSVIVAMSVALVGCSLKLQVNLFNNAGEAVTAKLEDSSLPIGPGGFVQFDYPGTAQNWILYLSTATCDYGYAVPRALEPYPRSQGSNGPLKVQVEKDFSIYLLPPTAETVTAVESLGPLQQDGFPLRPVSKSCH